MKNNIDWVSVGKRIVSLRTINNMSRDRDRRIIRREKYGNNKRCSSDY